MQPNATALSAHDLTTLEAPVQWHGSLGNEQNPGGGPPFFSSAHMATDPMDGSVYGLLYVFDPQPAYRIFRVLSSNDKSNPSAAGQPSGRRVERVGADVIASAQGREAAAPGPSYNHQGVSITPSYLVLPELSLRMPAGRFDWSLIEASYVPASSGGRTYFHLLDKSTGARLGRYWIPACFSWHSVNAFENRTHVSLDIHLERDNTTLDAFRNNSLDVYYWHGKLARVTMPRPPPGATEAEWPLRQGPARLSVLSAPEDKSPEFAVVNPAHLWSRPTRYAWGLATDEAHKDVAWFQHVVRFDLASPARSKRWTPPKYDGGGHGVGPAGKRTKRNRRKRNWWPAPPIFVPRTPDQGPDESAGAVIMFAVDNSTGVPNAFILDGGTHEQVCQLELPLPRLQVVGLHNHFSAYPTSV